MHPIQQVAEAGILLREELHRASCLHRIISVSFSRLRLKMRMTIRNKFSLIGITALLICFAVIFFGRKNRDSEKVFLHATAVQTVYGWGYNIMADSRIYIKQEFIPSIPGKQGFKSSEDALRVANLVIKRISDGQEATITPQDLDSLGVWKK